MNVSSLSSLFSSYQAETNTRSQSSTRLQAANLLDDAPPEMSALGSFMKQLQELQESDPDKFTQVLAMIAEKLTEAAKEANEDGDTRLSDMLGGLADRFSTASQNGEMPDLTPPKGGRPPIGPPPTELLGLDSGSDPMSTLTSIMAGMFASDAS